MKRTFQPDVCQGRVALITGGGSGIGQEIAIQLAKFGAKVAVMGRREAVLQSTVDLIKGNGHQAMYIVGDVRSHHDADATVQQVVEAFGKLDVLVNSAAGNFLALSDKLSTNAFRTVMDIDTVGTFNMSRAAFDELRKSGDGRIINITATIHKTATWYQVHASAVKAAIDSITRTLALEWGQFGIRVVSVAPGPIAHTTGTLKLAGDVPEEEINNLLKKRIPVGRIGTKSDIASAVLFLVSPAGSFISGDALIVDGAQHLFKPPVMPRETLSSWSKSMEKKIKHSKL